MAEEDTLQDQPNEEVEDQQKPDEPTQEPEAQEEEFVDEEPEGEDEDSPEEEPKDEPLSPRAQKRVENLKIRNLIASMKDEKPGQPFRGEPGLDYKETLDADPETLQKLEEDRSKYGETSYQQGVRQAEAIRWESRLEIDAPRVHGKYSQLDPESDNFNPAVADAINTWYLATSGYDNNTGTVQNSRVRYADFVDGVMELAEAAAGEKIARTSKNVAKQAANTGLRPDGSQARRLNLNQAPQNMSDEELDAIISSSIPKR